MRPLTCELRCKHAVRALAARPARVSVVTCTWLIIALVTPTIVRAFDYDPLVEDAHWHHAQVLELSIDDRARQRVIPVRVYLPASPAAAPIVLFSHGLGGSRAGSGLLGDHWAARGYVCMFIQHPGSDRATWEDAAPADRERARLAAGNAANFHLRVADVHAALDALARWNDAPGQPLQGRLDLRRIGVAGHSFGALTAQAVAGERFGLATFIDPRIKAALLLSPSSPRHGDDPVAAFGAVGMPWLMMMGSLDALPFGDPGAGSRRAVFASLPAGNKYELVLDGAAHQVFVEQPLPGDTGTRNPRYHRAILAISTAFWDAWLVDSPAARAWLDSDAPRAVLEAVDRWERK